MSNAKIILDTNVVSYLMKGGPLAEAYGPHVEGRLLAIAFITVGELYFGAEKGNWGEKKRKKLETTLRNFVVIPYDNEIARCYGRLVAEQQRKGNSMATNDAWMVCRELFAELRHGVPLVTHNAKHFRDLISLNIITERPAV